MSADTPSRKSGVDRLEGYRALIAVDRYDGKPNGDRIVESDGRLRWYESHPEAWGLVEVMDAEGVTELRSERDALWRAIRGYVEGHGNRERLTDDLDAIGGR